MFNFFSNKKDTEQVRFTKQCRDNATIVSNALRLNDVKLELANIANTLHNDTPSPKQCLNLLGRALECYEYLYKNIPLHDLRLGIQLSLEWSVRRTKEGLITFERSGE